MYLIKSGSRVLILCSMGWGAMFFPPLVMITSCMYNFYIKNNFIFRKIVFRNTIILREKYRSNENNILLIRKKIKRILQNFENPVSNSAYLISYFCSLLLNILYFQEHYSLCDKMVRFRIIKKKIQTNFPNISLRNFRNYREIQFSCRISFCLHMLKKHVWPPTVP